MLQDLSAMQLIMLGGDHGVHGLTGAAHIDSECLCGSSQPNDHQNQDLGKRGYWSPRPDDRTVRPHRGVSRTVGTALAALACLAGVVLVYTGFALSWRRFFPRRRAAG